MATTIQTITIPVDWESPATVKADLIKAVHQVALLIYEGAESRGMIYRSNPHYMAQSVAANAAAVFEINRPLVGNSRIPK